MFVRATGAIIAPISLMRWNAAVSIGRSENTMTKDDWQNVIIKLDNLEVFSSRGRCKACVYESNCDEHTDCNEGMAEFMAKIEQEVNNDEKC